MASAPCRLTPGTSTIEIIHQRGIISADPGEGAYRTDLTEAAWALLGDSVDLTGEGFTKAEVEVTPGGE